MDEGQKPWEKTWNDVESLATTATNNVKNAVSNISQGVMPWEKDWSAKPKPPEAKVVQTTEVDSDWKSLTKLPSEKLQQVAYNDPRLDSYAASIEKKYGLPEGLVLAVKNAGERSQSSSVSPAGAKGVMQFIDSTREAYPHDYKNPLESIDAAGKYFKDLLKQYGGDVKAAIAAYNGGSKAGKAVLDGKEPPAKETRDYWTRIEAYMKAKMK